MNGNNASNEETTPLLASNSSSNTHIIAGTPALSGSDKNSMNIANNSSSIGTNSSSTASHTPPVVTPTASSRIGPTRPPADYRPPNAHKLGPQRTSFTTQKLKLLPDDPFPDDEESGREVYSQVTRIKDPPARKDAERLGKAHRSMLPRVTAYCTAASYRMRDLTKYLASRKNHDASPKLFDECLYTTYSYRRDIASPHDDIIRLDDEGGEIDVGRGGKGDIFLFEYGVAVLWGFTVLEEKRFLKELAKFETEKLADEDVQTEEFNFYITKSYQPRVSEWVIWIVHEGQEYKPESQSILFEIFSPLSNLDL